jgi:lipoprotein NlpI
MKKGDFEGAAKSYEQALKLKPSDKWLFANRGYAHYNKGEWRTAIEDFRSALEGPVTDANKPYYQLRIYMARCRLGERPQAREELGKAVAGDPKRWSDPWVKMLAEYLLGKVGDKELISKAGSDRGHLCEAHFYAGSVKLVDRDSAAATKHFQQCVETDVWNFTEHTSAGAELKRTK